MSVEEPRHVEDRAGDGSHHSSGERCELTSQCEPCGRSNLCVCKRSVKWRRDATELSDAALSRVRAGEMDVFRDD